ncbi:type II toxin-antitoxin system RelE/ParE family toxin [Bordetella petrii]|nr:type II toxin-antitoxin system RelE/ParE family toxin [Bordetella petrii]
MRIYKTRQFHHWALREGLQDQALVAAVAEMESGLIDAVLGGHVMKKRIALPGRGKRGGARTLVAYCAGSVAFFMYGFAKHERDDINGRELKALRQLAGVQLALTLAQLHVALRQGALIEVSHG